jgi:hypothetical protein
LEILQREAGLVPDEPTDYESTKHKSCEAVDVERSDYGEAEQDGGVLGEEVVVDFVVEGSAHREVVVVGL